MTETKRTCGIVRKVDPAAHTVTFEAWRYGEDEKRITVATYVFAYGDLPDTLNAEATAHGWNQKVGDKAAKDAGTSPEAKLDEIRAEGERIRTELTWNAKTRATKSADTMLAELSGEQLVAKLSPEQVAAIVAAAQAKLDNAKA